MRPSGRLPLRLPTGSHRGGLTVVWANVERQNKLNKFLALLSYTAVLLHPYTTATTPTATTAAPATTITQS